MVCRLKMFLSAYQDFRSAFSPSWIPCHEFRVCTWLFSYQICYCFTVRKSPAVRASCNNTQPQDYPEPPLHCHTEVHGQETLVPWRDLWSSLAGSGPAPLSRNWWGPRERPGIGSGHCRSSLDTQSRQKHVSDEGLEGNRGVESGTDYTWGFSYFRGSVCNIPKAPNLRALNQTHFLSHMGSAGEAYINSKLSLLWGKVFSAPMTSSCQMYIISGLWELHVARLHWLHVYRKHTSL